MKIKILTQLGKPYFILGFFLITSFTQAQSFTAQYAWLVGKWEMKNDKMTTVEEWSIKDDSTFFGRGFLVFSDGKTKDLEQIEFRKRGGKLCYVPLVHGQNNNKEVEFAVNEFHENKFKAENSAHDFPQIIQYELLPGGELMASIEGTKNGKLRRQNWTFKK